MTLAPQIKPSPQPIFLKDYAQPPYWITTVDLFFDLHEESCQVRSILTVEQNPAVPAGPLVLNGEGLRLDWLRIDGTSISSSQYIQTDTTLTLPPLGKSATIEIQTTIEPHKNLAFEGLYKSGGIFCTQCEAEGFRKITYFLDRPDVMSIYSVTIEADPTKYPVLLSNGNLQLTEELEGGRRRAKWSDPFKKPCYLFALVAGDLRPIEEEFVTKSGRKVKLQIFARAGLQDRCVHAMLSLKKAMKWDEDVFGREYDLDIFMIVAVDDFNMGAMENKGLNVFNSNYILAKSDIATDTDFDVITAVVGHEYFHNWTGNRITCRDWFQLSLKEGLTVFRDQLFSMDMTSKAVKRIEDVVRLRTFQLAEDAGPMAHPIRPTSYIEINNFYTVTIYEKGAEVIRMIYTILGPTRFRKAMDTYFDLYDGKAVTTDDFVHAMEVSSKEDFTQFKNWYNQAGTPIVKVQSRYDESTHTYQLTMQQSCPPTPGQSKKEPFHIPIAVGLLNSQGHEMDLCLEEVEAATGSGGTKILHLRQSEQTFTFTNIAEKPVLSMLRGFSAPIKVEAAFTDEELSFLMAHDPDEFNRWEAAQTLSVRTIQEVIVQIQKGQTPKIKPALINAFGALIESPNLDPAFKAHLLTLPSETYLMQFSSPVDIEAIHSAREAIVRALAETYRASLTAIYQRYHHTDPSKTGSKVFGARALKNTALHILARLEEKPFIAMALEQVRSATNMTDELEGLNALNRMACPEREEALTLFYRKWHHEKLVMNKWFAIQAMSPLPDTLTRIQKLGHDAAFDSNNPNKIYALYVGFGTHNLIRFHDASGMAYKFIAEQILDIDSRNPQVSARLVTVFNNWKRFDLKRQGLMKEQLERIVGKNGISNNVFEIASKALL